MSSRAGEGGYPRQRVGRDPGGLGTYSLQGERGSGWLRAVCTCVCVCVHMWAHVKLSSAACGVLGPFNVSGRGNQA